MAEKNIFEEPLQNNNNQETNEYNISEPYQDNQQSNQNNVPEPSQNNIQGTNQNNNPGSYQNNNPVDYYNGPNVFQKETDPKMVALKIKFCSIMTIIFIAEVILMIIALPSIEKAGGPQEGSSFSIGSSVVFIFLVYPPIIILSIMELIAAMVGAGKHILPIIFSIYFFIVNGAIMISFLTQHSKKVTIFGIILEVLNFLLAALSACYQIILMKKMKK